MKKILGYLSFFFFVENIASQRTILITKIVFSLTRALRQKMAEALDPAPKARISYKSQCAVAKLAGREVGGKKGIKSVKKEDKKWEKRVNTELILSREIKTRGRCSRGLWGESLWLERSPQSSRPPLIRWRLYLSSLSALSYTL